MKRFLIFVALVGCGPSVREQYSLETDVLKKLEGELYQAEQATWTLDVEVKIAEEMLADPAKERILFGTSEVSRDKAIAGIEKAKAEHPANVKRFNELKPKVETQRQRVKDLEAKL